MVVLNAYACNCSLQFAKSCISSTLCCVGGEATHIHACCQTHLSFTQFVNNLNYVSIPICSLSIALNLSLSMDVTAHMLMWVSSAVTAGVLIK